MSTVTNLRAKLVVSNHEANDMIIRQIPIAQAAIVTGLGKDLIAHLIRYKLVTGSHELVDLEEISQIANELQSVRQPVEGQPILISKAAEEYGFNRHTIYKWAHDGWIQILVEEPRRKANRGDLAVARYLADRIGHRRAVFPPKPRSGRPKKR